MSDHSFYLYTVFAFPPELLTAGGIFLMHQKRNSFAPVRLVLCVTICLLISWLWKDTQDTVLAMLRYFTVFFVFSSGIYLCFEMPVQTVVFYAVTAYAIQHTAYILQGWIAPIWPMHSHITFYLQYYSIYIITYFLLWKILYPRSKSAPGCRLEGKPLLLISAALITITLILNYIRVLYGQDLNLAMQSVCACYALISCSFALALQFGLLKTSRLEQEVEVIERLWAADKKQYQLARENMDLINTKCHDIKHMIQAIKDSGAAPPEQAIKEMEESIAVYDSLARTGNTALDTILSQKSLICGKNGITLTCMADGKALDFIDTLDLYSIFGNIIDNAIEGVIQLQDEEQRIIGITVSSDGNFLCIHTENYYSHPLSFSDGLPETTKGDNSYHGYGLKSVRMLVEKYGGHIKIRAQDNIFNLDIIIPVKKQGQLH